MGAGLAALVGVLLLDLVAGACFVGTNFLRGADMLALGETRLLFLNQSLFALRGYQTF